MPRMQGVWRQEWANCDRCGFPHPIGMLTRQLGLLVCHDHGCYDDLTNYFRANVIAMVLSDPSESLTDKPQIYGDPGELVF